MQNTIRGGEFPFLYSECEFSHIHSKLVSVKLFLLYTAEISYREITCQGRYSRMSYKWIVTVSEKDKIKEEIGWLKILLGLLVAVNIPLVAWIAGNFTTAPLIFSLTGVILAVLFICAMIIVNFLAYRAIRKLGEL